MASCSGTESTSSAPVGVASGAINVAVNAQEDPIEAYVDPQAMQSADYDVIADNLAQYHINIVQFYDWGYRHDKPYTAADSWRNLEGIFVTKTETQNLIQAFWKYGVFTQLYVSWNGAYSDWPTQDTNVLLSMGAFTNRCGLSGSCTPAEQFVTALGWSAWGWMADGSVQENPGNGTWTRWIVSQYRAAMSGWGFNGVHVDTMGVPLYDWRGNPLPNLGASLADFVNYAGDLTGVCTDINQVSGWNIQDVAVRGRSCNLYVEPHPEFNNFGKFSGVDALTQQFREWSSRPIILAYYPQQVMSGTLSPTSKWQVASDNVTVCNPNSQTGCMMANNPGIELLAGQVALSGASPLLLGDYDHIIPGPFFPGASLGIDANLQQYLADYWNWFVGQRDVLRDGVTPDTSLVACLTDSSGNALGDSSGVPGKIYTKTWGKAGIAAGLSLTNLIGLSDNRVDDPDGLHRPTEQQNISATLTYYGSTVPGTLWYSAPDINHGFPQSVSYTNDSTNRRITFTVPDLKTVGLLVLEGGNLEAANHDYTVDTSDYLRGGSFNKSVNGMGRDGALAVHGCCERWARWDAVDLGASGVASLQASVSSGTGGTIEFHADAPNGPLLATLYASPGDNSEGKTVPAAHALTGVHPVYAVWPRRDVTLNWWLP